MIDHKNVYEAIHGVMQDVGYVKKGKASGLAYSFVGEAAILKKIRPAMLEHGLILFPKEVDPIYDSFDLVKISNGEKRESVINVAKVKVTFTCYHVSSGTSIDIQTVGEGADNWDKEVPKALTIAMKYALRHLFMLETGDDPDDPKNIKGTERVKSITPAERNVPPVVKQEEALSSDEKEKLEQLEALNRLKATLSTLCKARGGRENPKVMEIINTKADGNFKNINSVELAQEIIGLIKTLPTLAEEQKSTE